MLVSDKKKIFLKNKTQPSKSDKNSLLCSPLKRKVLTVVTISLPLSECVLGRPLPPFLYESHLPNPAEVGTRCRHRVVDEISIAVITIIEGEKKRF